jgi:hypothetical protein
MALPWLIALKVIPWGDVIEHAPKVLGAARKLLERQRDKPADRPAPMPVDATGDAAPSLRALTARLADTEQQLHQQAQAQEQLAQTLAELAEQNARLVSAVEVLRVRTRLLLGSAALMALALAWLLTR